MQTVMALIRDDLEQVEAQFKKDLDSQVSLIRKVGEYVLSSGGKRVRPMLLLLSARLAGYQGSAHVSLAGVIEFIHTATLLHDDVVDSAVLRRGNESANSVWGNQASVLVGDFLLGRSFSVMVENGDLDVLRVVSEASTQMAEGEMLQLIGSCDIDMDETRYLDVIRNKTAALIAAACRCGAILGRLDAAHEEALSMFGMDLGIAFQMMDDALDYVADEEDFGKTRGHDLAEGKMTLPLIHTLQNCSSAERERVEEIIERGELSPEELAEVCALIASYRGIDYTRQRAREQIDSAKGRLAPFDNNVAKDALFCLADYVVERTR
ncbi:MAG: polyprenyl synthetase family protein [Desulfuromonadales bacterium]|nr:polyprenyl synthetase family protein [Desulfuromonadales bacterium]